MLSANFKPKRTAAESRGFLATARLSCLKVATRCGGQHVGRATNEVRGTLRQARLAAYMGDCHSGGG